MAIVLKNGMIFLHCPRTGGTSIKHWLKQFNLYDFEIGDKFSFFEHCFIPTKGNKLNIIKYFWKTIRGKYPYSFFTFSCVRNPLDWYNSYFINRELFNLNPLKKVYPECLNGYNPLYNLNKLKADNFNEWVNLVLEEHPGFVTDLYQIYNGRKKESSHFVIQTENLFNEFCIFIGNSFDYSEINISERNAKFRESNSKMRYDFETIEQIIRSEYSVFSAYYQNILADIEYESFVMKKMEPFKLF